MSDRDVISVEKVAMAYRLYSKPSDIMRETLFGRIRHDTFWALRDVSFTIQERQRVGIIGPNGAGKSTLLQIIAGNLRPTAGHVTVNGKISSLLSLVPAWNTEASGLENIRFNLLMQGAIEESIPELIDEIVEFTELGQFIHHPVKTYSSGMSARLAFAIATAVSPEILIIDEVLGAGDGYFANKATQRMQSMCEQGRALLFVSHSLAAVRSLCETAIWLENGTIRLVGPVDTVVVQYEEDMLRQQEETIRAGNMLRRQHTVHLPTLEDITDPSLVRFRLRGAVGHRIHDTHCVRRISVASVGQAPLDVALDHVDIRLAETTAALELVGCEWGRAFTRNGISTRVLAPRTGSRKGGHFLVRRPIAYLRDNWPVEIVIETQPLNRTEMLALDALDVNDAVWTCLTASEPTQLSDGWERLVFDGVIAPVRGEAAVEAMIARVTEQIEPPVRILDVNFVVAGRLATTVREHEAFGLEVRIAATQPVAEVSVNLTISRSDGVYTFWQPSGWVENLRQFSGEAIIRFQFENNFFGAGDYEVSVTAVNGWSWDNIPPSDVYDRRLSCLRFSVVPEHAIKFGLINVRVPVEVTTVPAVGFCKTA
jgi:lipopolysaccharide transport system ATP-binding protein